MRTDRPWKERLTSLALIAGCLVVVFTAVGSASRLSYNEDIASDLEAAREAATAGDLETAFEHLLAVTERVPDSVGAMRSAVCLAPEVGRGEVVPLLLSDLLVAGWNWQVVPLGCESEHLYRTMFDVLAVPGAAVVMRVPDIEDEVSLDLEKRARQLVQDAPEEVDPLRIAQLLALSACVNDRHGLELMGRVQLENALAIDRRGLAVLPHLDRCTEGRS